MSSTTRAPRRRLALALVPGLLLVSIGGGSALAQSPSVGPDAPVTSSPPVTVTVDDGAIPAIPNPAVTGAQPVPFERVTVGADGRTLTIDFWNGAEGCYGLKDVTVTQTDDGYAITVWTGMLPEAINRTCIAIAQLYSTQVVLDTPVFTDGGLD